MSKLALAGLIVAASTHGAHAECAPLRFLGTPALTDIPRQGSLYLFDQRSARTELQTDVVTKFGGAPGIARVTMLGDGVERLDYVYAGFGEGTLEVTLPDESAHAFYHIDSAWHAAAAPRVLQYWRDPDASVEWARSDAMMIQIDQPVAAVVATWTFDGVATEWLVPPQTVEDFLGVSVVTLGDVSCGMQNLDMAELHAGGHLELTAIYFDGARAPISGLPQRLAEDQMPATEGGISNALKRGIGARAVEPAPPPPPAVAALPADWNPMRGLDDALWLGLAAGGALVFAFLLIFRLRPSLRDGSGSEG